MIWIALAAMTVLAMGFVLWPLAFRARETAENRALDDREAAFYRAQLAEIERDVERGQLPAEEAAAARAEAARRLIGAIDDAPLLASAGALWRRRIAAAAMLAVVPAVALAVYIEIGQPDLPDAPLSARKADPRGQGALEAAVAKIEAHLMKEPGDRRGWEVLAPVYMRLGRFEEAASAYKRLIALGDEAPIRHAELGEALIALNDGVVTEDARAQLEKAPDAPMAKFYLALALEQDGKIDDAKAAYAALAPQAKGREPWMLGLRQRLGATSSDKPPAPATREPGFSPEQRQMIEGMVQGLAARLADKGGSPEEWGRLIRAYSVLHEPDKARDALASARKALGSNSDIDALAKELGI